MKGKILVAESQAQYDEVTKLLEAGWVLDPRVTDGKPYRLEACSVWPLVFYESEEEKPKDVEEVHKGPLDDVVDVIDVDSTQVSEKVKDGYVVHEIFSKSVKMVKRKVGP